MEIITLKDFQDEKQQLEKEICEKLYEFSKKHNIAITDMNLIANSYRSCNGCLIIMKYDLKLETNL